MAEQRYRVAALTQYSAAGIVRVKVAPRPGVDFTAMSPLCAWAISLTSASPNPVGLAPGPAGVFATVRESGEERREGLRVDAHSVVDDGDTDLLAGAVDPQLDRSAVMLMRERVVDQRGQRSAQRGLRPDHLKRPIVGLIALETHCHT